MMKAILYEEYGSPEVLHLQEVEKPCPNEGDVLVKIHSASVNAADWHTLRGTPFLFRVMNGLTRPREKAKILGDDMSGWVEDVGENVKQFQPGDEVFGISNFGAFAEFRCVPENNLAHKPRNLSFEEATTLPIAGITALQGLRDNGQIQTGKKVLINGASGGVGTFAVQIAKSFGTEVTGVCSTGKLEMVRSIGADHVVDYKKENLFKNGHQYDLIFAVGGNHSILEYRRALSPGGCFVCVGGSMTQYIQALLLGPLISITGSRKMGVAMPILTQEDLVYLTTLWESGKLKPVIDKSYSLSEVPEAIRYVEEGYVKGKVVITV